MILHAYVYVLCGYTASSGGSTGTLADQESILQLTVRQRARGKLTGAQVLIRHPYRDRVKRVDAIMIWRMKCHTHVLKENDMIGSMGLVLFLFFFVCGAELWPVTYIVSTKTCGRLIFLKPNVGEWRIIRRDSVSCGSILSQKWCMWISETFVKILYTT